MAVELVIRLPPVNKPRFDFQLLGREILDAQAVEEPRRVGRHEGRLVSPVVEIVIAEQADVRHEDSGVDVQSVCHVEVVAAVRLRNVPVSIADIPLADPGAAIAARCRGGKHVRT